MSGPTGFYNQTELNKFDATIDQARNSNINDTDKQRLLAQLTQARDTQAGLSQTENGYVNQNDPTLLQNLDFFTNLKTEFDALTRKSSETEAVYQDAVKKAKDRPGIIKQTILTQGNTAPLGGSGTLLTSGIPK